MLQNDPIKLPPFHFDSDPDPNPDFHFDADPEPAFHFGVRVRIRSTALKGSTGQQMTFLFIYSAFTLGAINDGCDCAGYNITTVLNFIVGSTTCK
jgi:hypothetical protein